LIKVNKEIFYDYKEVAELLTKQATFYQKIILSDRFFSVYFFVGYYGKGFPKTLRKNEYIYRGLELERISNFIDRMKKKFPKATIIPQKEKQIHLDEDMGQYLQIFSVLPATIEEAEGRGKVINKSMPVRIQRYNDNNDVNVFYYTRAKRKNKERKDKLADVEDLWTTLYFLVTNTQFPCEYRRLQIMSKEKKKLTPIETAVRGVIEKNKELEELLEKNKISDDIKRDPLLMLINGIVNAGVNGGPSKYKEAFLNHEFYEKNPDKKDIINRLRANLKKQIEILGEAIAFHKTVCSPEMKKMQDLIEGLMGEFRSKILDK